MGHSVTFVGSLNIMFTPVIAVIFRTLRCLQYDEIAFVYKELEFRENCYVNVLVRY